MLSLFPDQVGYNYSQDITVLLVSSVQTSASIVYTSPYAGQFKSNVRVNSVVAYPSESYKQLDYTNMKVDFFVNSTGLSYIVNNLTECNTVVKRVLGSPSTSVLSYYFHMIYRPVEIEVQQVNSSLKTTSSFSWSNDKFPDVTTVPLNIQFKETVSSFVTTVIDASLNTFKSHQISGVNEIQKTYVSYPFGFKSNSNPSSLTFEAVFSMNEYRLPNTSISIYRPQVDYASLETAYGNTTSIDDLPPSLINLNFVAIDPFTYLVQAEVNDSMSRVATLMLYYGRETIDTILLTSADVVGGGGDNNNHVFWESIVTINSRSTNYIPRPREVHLFDYTGNQMASLSNFGRVYSLIYNANFKTINSPGLPITIDMITTFKFDKYVMDVSSGSVNNRLLFNMSKIVYSWKPELVFGDDLQNPMYRARGKYDYSLQLYVIPFTVPARTFTTSMNYFIDCRPEHLDIAFFNLKFPNTSTVQIISTYGDELPPMITKILAFPNKTVDISKGTSTLIGWDLTIEDVPNGFSKGVFNISSNTDGQYRVITIGNEQLVNGVYQLRFNVSMWLRTQTFTIQDILLIDTSNNTGRYHKDYFVGPDNLMSSINPLGKVMGSPELNLTIISNTGAVTAPQVVSVQLSRTSVDVGSSDRSVGITFTVDCGTYAYAFDHSPMVYFTSSFDQITGCTATLFSDDQVNVIIFQANCTLPYSFGWPSRVAYLSIHGLMNIAGYMSGFSNQALPNNNVTRLDISFSQTTPIIERYLVSPGSVTIIGRNFGLAPGLVKGALDFGKSVGMPLGILPSIQSGSMLIIESGYIMAKPFNITIKNLGISSNMIQVNDLLPTNSSGGNGGGSSGSGDTNGNSTQPTVTCPGSPPCSNNGVCSPTQGCQCVSGWYGEDCLSKVTDSVPTYQDDQPETTIVDNKTSTISTIDVVKLKEFDNVGNMVDQMGGGLVVVNVQWFDQDTDILFAGDTIHMKKSTLKYTINLSNYTFKSTLNTLQVIMRVAISGPDSNTCTQQSVGNIDGEDNSLYWMRLRVNDVSLYGHFIQRALVDNRTHIISNVLLDSSEQQSNNQEQATMIGINVPHFDHQVTLDPDFQLLIDTDGNGSGTCGSRSKSLSTNALIGIIVGVAIITTAIVVAIVMWRLKKHKDIRHEKQMQIKLQKLTS
ncbi:hypothetical protein SAMD00019534_052370 [Acytostelium subglobosum LB1]|uniref:hypothetical protein n=1 Tax=Acytostelium subglobosum LB1 TaxID=1410327 RepID=UPI000644C192|nr:hypothetical protein SAMD00019534_052370 [Acytostelium subglobosum LB1]GAM22062.1 hypothetical protein SAMD00019534_052370 [Acytostelium subglobosum LB1]|eukprot:XP_012755162.1 hypothetical protein SAMD00019534_052370 [Acytostelium subglobosum LB1]